MWTVTSGESENLSRFTGKSVGKKKGKAIGVEQAWDFPHKLGLLYAL